ncbi:hypothetical protein IAT40_005003 [Kwoniella sp. CBS 6097]
MNSSHPFFVNQTPYLRNAVASSSKHTLYSASSVYSNPEFESSSPTSHTRNNSTASVNTLASETSITSTSFSLSSSSSRMAPIDRECLRWMQREDSEDHLFGSVSCRGRGLSVEEREVKRRAMEQEQQRAAEREDAEKKAIKAERRKGRIGKSF